MAAVRPPATSRWHPRLAAPRGTITFGRDSHAHVALVVARPLISPQPSPSTRPTRHCALPVSPSSNTMARSPHGGPQQHLSQHVVNEIPTSLSVPPAPSHTQTGPFRNLGMLATPYLHAASLVVVATQEPLDCLELRFTIGRTSVPRVSCTVHPHASEHSKKLLRQPLPE